VCAQCTEYSRTVRVPYRIQRTGYSRVRLSLTLRLSLTVPPPRVHTHSSYGSSVGSPPHSPHRRHILILLTFSHTFILSARRGCRRGVAVRLSIHTHTPDIKTHTHTRAPRGARPRRICWPPLCNCKTRWHATTRRACRHPPPAHGLQHGRAAASSGTLRPVRSGRCWSRAESRWPRLGGLSGG
jgi:hypothetical protein